MTFRSSAGRRHWRTLLALAVVAVCASVWAADSLYLHLKVSDATSELQGEPSSDDGERTTFPSYYPPSQRAGYRSPVFASPDTEVPYSMYGRLCGFLYGSSCDSRSDEAHPTAHAIAVAMNPGDSSETESVPYRKPTSRHPRIYTNWTDLIQDREAFNFPGGWRGKEYLKSMRVWEKKLAEYSDMVGRVPGMSLGLRKLYDNGKSNYYAAYRAWYRKYLSSQEDGKPDTWNASVQPSRDWEKQREEWELSVLHDDELSRNASERGGLNAYSSGAASKAPGKYGEKRYRSWQRVVLEWPDALRNATPAAEHWAKRWRREARGMGRRANHRGWKDRPAQWKDVEGENWPYHRWKEMGGLKSYKAWQAAAAAADAAAGAPAAWPGPFSPVGASPAAPAAGRNAWGTPLSAGELEWCHDLLPYCGGPENPGSAATHDLTINCATLVPYCTARTYEERSRAARPAGRRRRRRAKSKRKAGKAGKGTAGK